MPHRIKEFAKEQVKDAESLIVSDPTEVKLGTQVIDAVDAILKDPRTQTVYVVDEDGLLEGLVTVHELLKVSSIQVGATKKKSILKFFKYMTLIYSETVDDIMRRPLSVKMNDTLIHALQLMEENNLFDLPVVDEDNRLIGELSGLEILTVLRDKLRSEKK